MHAHGYETTLTLQGNNTAGTPVNTTLSRQQLEQLPQTTITTHLPWLEGKAVFTGVKLTTLLATYKLHPQTIHLKALNDYTATVTWEHIQKYEPIVATRKDNQWLRIRDYGPYWLIFSLDQFPELNQRKSLGKMVWQLETITTE
ncbi:oxidoreductase [Photobacterium sp. TY1-4]|uniref:oxidoreductase n=1 Tax=Photobacterium sp. TY1-4 TaxID=2899122 RepID=UPI0021BE57BB|nr:oxidoreductase [Photobacterium sp. TY1-4]UXI02203.1 oxidoreductase [Photobacterium sp. TY1-4]